MNDQRRLNANSMADHLLRLASQVRMLANAGLLSDPNLSQMQRYLADLDATIERLTREVPDETRQHYLELARHNMEFLALVALGMFAEHADCPHATSPAVKVLIREHRLLLRCDQGCEWEWAPLLPI